MWYHFFFLMIRRPPRSTLFPFRRSSDLALLEKFEQEIWNQIPHREGDKIVNATPLVDLTADLKECAKSVFKLNLDDKDFTIYGRSEEPHVWTPVTSRSRMPSSAWKKKQTQKKTKKQNKKITIIYIVHSKKDQS